MKRVIAMVRTSTIKQSIEDQHNEMVEFLRSEGYRESEIEWVEEQGASAAKVDAPYQAMIAKVKETIVSNTNIKAVAVWHLNRAFRTEDSYVDLKGFLVGHKVQLLCKNPYLRLLKPDGKIDPGMELAAGLLAILSKQDQDERKEKFARAKKANAAKGKYNGGTPKFGYCVDDDGYVVPDETQAAIVNQIYELYATGRYSDQSLSKELSDLGVVRDNGRPFTPDALNRMLRDTAYIGYTDDDKGRSHRKFVPIVSEGLWKKVEEARQKNYKDIPRTNLPSLGNKVIKCPVCGSNLHRDGKHYICWQHNSHSTAARSGNPCSYSLSIPAYPTHSILWALASEHYISSQISTSLRDTTSYQKKVETIERKITTLEGRKEALQRRKDKVVDSYIEELLTKPQRDEKLARIASDEKDLDQRLQALRTDLKKALRVIDYLSAPEGYIESIKHLVLQTLQERDLEKMYQIIRDTIISCKVTRTQFGPADPRSKTPNALEYTIEAVDGYTYHYLYLPCSQKEFRYFGKDRNGWHPIFLDVLDV